MRVSALLMSVVLAAGALFATGTLAARADSGSSGRAESASQIVATPAPASLLPAQTLPALPATQDEEQNYARRESESPAAVANYSGGFIAAVLIVVVLVLLIVYLVQRT